MIMTDWRIVALAASLALAPSASLAQGSELGAREYINSCAACHGADGKGSGVVAGYLTSPLPDLTTLQAGNGGVFPFAALYGIIDGTDTSGPHGTSEMPAWGSRYNSEAPRMLGEMSSPDDLDFFVRGRILALIEHISTIQEN
jgi:mono/diheme cytochrome c family protein